MISPVDRGIYLASRSPRRRELLSQIGVRYHLLLFRSRPDAPPDVDESMLPGEAPDAYVERIARAKAEAGWKLLRLRNLSFRPYRRALIMENKLRAARWGTKAQLIDFGKEEEVPHGSLLEELLEFVDEVVDPLGSRAYCERAREIVAQGTGAERQLEVFRKTGDLKDVMDYVVHETEVGLDVPAVRS